MYTRLLTILAVSAFVLTLLFAVAAGAQDESTDAAATLGDGGGTQVQQAQQQQVGVQTIKGEPASPSGPLAGANVDVRGGDDGNEIDRGDELRIKGDYEVRSGASITIEDDDGTQGTFVDGRNANIVETDYGIRIDVTGAPIGVNGRDETLGESGDVEAVTSTDVQRDGGGSGNGGDADGGGDGGDGAAQQTPPPTQAQQTNPPTGTTDPNATTDPTATDPAATDPVADDVTAQDAGDSANREGSFQCEFFLRAVRDDRGALKAQYRGDEVVIQRFEQCLEADVLADTIPDKTLPFTGGPSLPFGGGVLLLVTGAALALRMFRR